MFEKRLQMHLTECLTRALNCRNLGYSLKETRQDVTAVITSTYLLS